MAWPAGLPNCSVLAEETAWPLDTGSVDRLVLLHALETADHWGLHLNAGADGPAGADPGASAGQPFRARLSCAWLPLSRFLNSMSRSLGHGDSYPFVLPDPVLDKLAFVDDVVRSARGVAWRDWPPAPRK